MADFFVFDKNDDDDDYQRLVGASDPRDKTIQILLSLALSVTAFLAFCVLRPRWAGLYGARKRQKEEATVLPDLPKTMFGWIIPLWKITDQQVLASAGLDAYAFLAFFKMGVKFLLVTLFFSVVVIQPVHDANPEEPPSNKTKHGHEDSSFYTSAGRPHNGTNPLADDFGTGYLWMYVVFVYLFSGIVIYLIISETRRIIEVRQEYLGTQTSVTDRTIRLSGIPKDLQDEGRLKDFIESLDIGKVERVTLCRNWKELDEAMTARKETLRRLEEAYTIHLSSKRVERSLESLPISQPLPPDPQPVLIQTEDSDENSSLVGASSQPRVASYERVRPKTTVRSGWLDLRGRRVDAIDYYEEQLRQADSRIKMLRQKTFAPTSLAFVTMDSVAACQMAIQAVLDPSPQQLIASQSPMPADVVWPNTYLSRNSRMLRSWSVTILIALLTIFWSSIIVTIATLLSTSTISKVWPQLGKQLEDHENLRSLINTQLSTAIASLLLVLAQYLYYYLSWYQGMISQGDVELSAISKNFFFTFFNFFVVLTVLGTASKFYQFLDNFGSALRNVREFAHTLALALQNFLNFYVNFIILQGLGLFPFRLLEVGSVSLYPLYRLGAKTPRDYAELVQPPVFSYGFYLPNALLIFIICMVYSVLRHSWEVLLAGLIFFAFGHFVYKYQLLYAMDHQQQATGRAWGMICDRLFVGLIFFQISTAGQLILKQAITRSLLVIPLTFVTIWISILYGKNYKPLMKFIALRSIQRGEQYTDHDTAPNVDSGANSITSSDDLAPERHAWAETNTSQLRYYRNTRTQSARAPDDSPETEPRFINPSLVAPLDAVWLADTSIRTEGHVEIVNGEASV